MMNPKHLAKAHNKLACTRAAIDQCIALMQGADDEEADALYKELQYLAKIRDALIEMLEEDKANELQS